MSIHILYGQNRKSVNLFWLVMLKWQIDVSITLKFKNPKVEAYLLRIEIIILIKLIFRYIFLKDQVVGS